jgi:hypothetical protein
MMLPMATNPKVPQGSATAIAEAKPPEAPVRNSNEVAGYQYSYWKTVAISLGSALSFLLLLPLIPFITSWQTGNPRFRRQYFKTFWYYLRLLPGYIIHGTLLRTLRYNFFMTPAQQAERIRLRRGACTRCGKCCSQLECIFLERDSEGRGQCSVYGTTFWYYGTCGRYPLSQQDIDDHACPGFTFYDADGALAYEV